MYMRAVKGTAHKTWSQMKLLLVKFKNDSSKNRASLYLIVFDSFSCVLTCEELINS